MSDHKDIVEKCHKLFDAAGMASAAGASCDDPECFSHLIHRTHELISERDALKLQVSELQKEALKIRCQLSRSEQEEGRLSSQNEELVKALKEIHMDATVRDLDPKLAKRVRERSSIAANYVGKRKRQTPGPERQCADCLHDDVTMGWCLPEHRGIWEAAHCAECCVLPTKWKKA